MKPKSRPDKWIFLIAVFKLVKGCLLVAAGIGVLRLVHRDVANVFTQWIDVLRVDPDNRYAHALLAKVLSLDDRKLREIGAGTFFYAALFFTEGFGLLLQKRWAQYFTIIVTASLLPLEIFEMIRHASGGKAAIILLNVAIVVYLAIRLRREIED
jgi:uncharacterized membrane protein (DUF2068 family)